MLHRVWPDDNIFNSDSNEQTDYQTDGRKMHLALLYDEAIHVVSCLSYEQYVRNLKQTNVHLHQLAIFSNNST